MSQERYTNTLATTDEPIMQIFQFVSIFMSKLLHFHVKAGFHLTSYHLLGAGEQRTTYFFSFHLSCIHFWFPTWLRLEVERVKVIDLGEGEDPRERQEEVEHQDDEVVGGQEGVDVALVGDGGHCELKMMRDKSIAQEKHTKQE